MKKDIRKILDGFFRDNHYSDEDKADEALELIHKAVRICLPKMLYRYRPCTKNSIKGFRNDSVIAVSPSVFNDPYDCLLKYDPTINSGRLSNEEFDKIVAQYKLTGLLPDDIEQHMPLAMLDEFKGYLDQYITGQWTFEEGDEGESGTWGLIRENVLDPCSEVLHKLSRVSCFSERKDSMLMWSHYTNQHQGFVLGYDLKTDYNKETIDNLFPVIYSKKRYDAIEAVRFLLGSTIKMRNIVNEDQLFYLAASLYKSKDWAYEKEWRLISYGNEEEFVEFKLRPSCIIYGSRIDQANYEKLHDIAVSKGIKEYKASIDRYSPYYKMRVERCK